MPERICPACKAVVPPRLKFCRECGGRVDDAADEAPEPGDATMVASLPRKDAGPVPTPIPSAGGDATVIGSFTARPAEKEPATMAPPPEDLEKTSATPPPAASGEAT